MEIEIDTDDYQPLYSAMYKKLLYISDFNKELIDYCMERDPDFLTVLSNIRIKLDNAYKEN